MIYKLQMKLNVHRIQPEDFEPNAEKSFLFTKWGGVKNGDAIEFGKYKAKLNDFAIRINHLTFVFEPSEANAAFPWYFRRDLQMLTTKEANYSTPISDGGGDVYGFYDFLEHVQNSWLTDSDGSGAPAKDGMVDDDWNINPSEFPENMPKDATHVVWYNK